MLKHGDLIPDFAFSSPVAAPVLLSELCEAKPAILIFLRHLA